MAYPVTVMLSEAVKAVIGMARLAWVWHRGGPRHAELRYWFFFVAKSYAGLAVIGCVWILVVDPSNGGPVLIRGGRLDGSGLLGFETGAEPPHQLLLDASAAGSAEWRSRASYTRLRSPGCYIYQVDGLNFTETIIFEAKAQP